DQLVGGEELARSGESLEDGWTAWQDRLPPLVLEAGRDFDHVVLGISLGALPGICRELVEDPSNPRFRRMLAALTTVGTQAIQLWMKPTAAELGWTRGDSIVIPYEEPLDTWTDMAHLIARESWRPGEVGAIGYLCSPMPDVEPIPDAGAGRGYVRRQNARVAENARGWLDRYSGWLWPQVARGTGLDGAVLVDRQERSGMERLSAQHFSAAANLSDRYNLSLPGSAAARLAPGGSGYANLVLAGDWTLNPINAGCVEAAVTSGLLAARVLSGEPRTISGDWLSALPDLAPVLSGRTEASPRRPLYVTLDGNDTPAPPFTARGTRMTVFPVAARRANLQALCDRLLHLGGPTRYRPIAPLVWFYAQDNQRIDSTVPPAGIRELDFGFLIPLLAVEPDGAARLVTFTPYLWVDTELACRAGRELYGYPKAVGQLGLPPVGSSGSFTVDGFLPEAGSWVERRLVETRPVAGLPAPAESETPAAAVAALVDTCRALGDGETAWDLVLEAAGELAAGVVPMVFLKQFRDAEAPETACYQALIEADVRRLGPFRAGGLLAQDHELVVADPPGFPLASRLGLTGRREDGSVVVPCRHPLWLEFDFVMDNGKEVWRAG
ncbi:MAG: acetoacetate decarboxylase family protein, partial [Thermoanaerobaculia bacterium]|nr:acetoacetate decarboxylase family protein [Thermoanaerobaculia bacterium]